MKRNAVIIILGILLIWGAFECPLYGFFGIPCPTCGMTRAWRLFLSGRIAEAFKMHPLFPVPAVFILPYFRKRRYVLGSMVIFAVVYIIRMYFLFPSVPPMNYNYNSMIGEFLK